MKKRFTEEQIIGFLRGAKKGSHRKEGVRSSIEALALRARKEGVRSSIEALALRDYATKLDLTLRIRVTLRIRAGTPSRTPWV